MTPSVTATGTETGTTNVWDKLRTLGNPDQWRDAGPEDDVAGVQPRMVFEPINEVELATALRYADSAGLSVIPRGNGSKLTWGNPPTRADLVLSKDLRKRDRIQGPRAGPNRTIIPNSIQAD